MAWKSITLTLLNSEDADRIEQHLLTLDAVAVTYTDAGDQAILEPALNTTPLWSVTNLTALFETKVNLDDIKASLMMTFGPGVYQISKEEHIKDKTWEREWLEHFEPMKFGKRLWVCPDNMDIPFEHQDIDDIVVDMDPGVAFGTGTHETTSLCLQWLDAAQLENKTVLDYGSGSGILAIAALKLGASHATCVDIDIQAILASLANAERNNVLDQFNAYLTDDKDFSQKAKFNIVLANILATPLIELVHDIRKRLRPNGQIVLSGILANQARSVLTIYSVYFNMTEIVQNGDWVRLCGHLKTPSEMLGDEECVTICPKCDESFLITGQDLEYADGEVRCGECNTVFSAIEYIDPDPEELGTEKTKNPKPVSDSTPKSELITGQWMHNKVKPMTEQEAAAAIKLAENTFTGASTQDLKSQSAEPTGSPLDFVLESEPEPSEPTSLTDTANREIDPILFEAVPAAVDLYELDKPEPMLDEELEALKAPKPSKKTFGWFLTSIFALLALGAQYLHQHRNQLAIHPSFGLPIQNLYSKLPLEIEPDWNLDAYSINASAVALNPLNTKQLVASFNLSNTALHAQIFPIIRLSLFNRWGERIAYKDLNVKDYSPQDFKENERALLSARDRIQVKVVIEDPGSEAMDYNVEVCLRKNSIIRCKEKAE